MTPNIVAKVVAFLALALAAPLAAAPAPAPGQVVVRQEVKVQKTVVENGVAKVQWVEPKTVLPGDRLHYAITYTNTAALPATNFVVRNHVQTDLRLAPESAANVEVSVDGGKSWGRLAAITVPDGKGGRRAATAADVTDMRWVIPAIAAGSTGKVEFYAYVR